MASGKTDTSGLARQYIIYDGIQNILKYVKNLYI